LRIALARAARLMAGVDIQAELAALPAMKRFELRIRLAKLTGKAAPKLGPMLLRHALAWELQASVYGGLSRRSQRRLVQLAGGGTQERASAGMTLVREWKGVLHTVTIDEHGMLHWNGNEWNSLSEVARAITGTRWSGPAFFGFKRKEHAA
jgi:hypothetical protein